MESFGDRKNSVIAEINQRQNQIDLPHYSSSWVEYSCFCIRQSLQGV